MENEVVIVVPGAKFIRSRVNFMQTFIRFLYRLAHVFQPVYYNYTRRWEKQFVMYGRTVIWLHWSRGITSVSRWLAKRKLRRLIRHYRNKPLKLVGISMGGEIILETLKEVDAPSVHEVILVCSTNTYTDVRALPQHIINVYSPADVFVRFATSMLAPLHGGQKLHGANVENVLIPQMTHDQFCADAAIQFGEHKGKTITQLISDYLVR